MLYFPCVFVESCWSTCFVLGLSGVLFCLGVRSSCVPTGYHGSTRRTVVVVGDLFIKVSSRFFSGFAVFDDIFQMEKDRNGPCAKLSQTIFNQQKIGGP